jgi:chemotaxis-related protein WspB
VEERDAVQVLVTTIGARRFALDLAEISEVLPMVSHHATGGGPAWLLGLFNLRGSMIPLVDLSVIVDGTATTPTLGSRIVVLRLEADLFEAALSDGPANRVGLLVPEIYGPFSRDFAQGGAHPGFAFAGTSHLGPTIADEAGFLQLLRCRRILEGDASLRELPRHVDVWEQP